MTTPTATTATNLASREEEARLARAKLAAMEEERTLRVATLADDLSDFNRTAVVEQDQRIASQRVTCDALDVRVTKARHAHDAAVRAAKEAELAELLKDADHARTRREMYNRIGARVVAFREQFVIDLDAERATANKQRERVKRARELAAELGTVCTLEPVYIDEIRLAVGVMLGALDDEGALAAFTSPVASPFVTTAAGKSAHPMCESEAAFARAKALLADVRKEGSQ